MSYQNEEAYEPDKLPFIERWIEDGELHVKCTIQFYEVVPLGDNQDRNQRLENLSLVRMDNVRKALNFKNKFEIKERQTI